MDSDGIRFIILGGGKLGRALALGLFQCGVRQDSILVIDRNPCKCKTLELLGFQTQPLINFTLNSTIIFLAVKPKDVKALLNQLLPYIQNDNIDNILVSAVSGVPLRALRHFIPANTPLARIKPNLFIEHAAGNVLIANENGQKNHDIEKLEEILSGFAATLFVPEELIESLGWESLSIPMVFVPHLIKRSLLDVPIKYREAIGKMLLMATKQTLDTLVAEESVLEAATCLADSVCTSGGTNEAALEVLSQNNFWELLSQAKMAYCEHAKTVSKHFSESR